MPSVARTEMNITELKFVTAYLIDPSSIAKAAKAAGVAFRTGQRYLDKQYIKDYISEKTKKLEEICEVTLEQVVNELKKIAFFQHTEYAKDFKLKIEEGSIGVELKDFKDMDTSAIASMNMKLNSQGIPYVEIKPYNKVDALKLLMEHLKGYQGPSDIHFHAESLEDKSAQEVSSTYQLLVNGEV